MRSPFFSNVEYINAVCCKEYFITKILFLSTDDRGLKHNVLNINRISVINECLPEIIT